MLVKIQTTKIKKILLVLINLKKPDLIGILTDAGKSNQFTEGMQLLRKQTIERHLTINDHQKAMIAKDNQQTKL
ncbi:313_t:CDS:2, partial [Gigaspora margarita]